MKLDHEATNFIVDYPDDTLQADVDLREWTAGWMCRREPSILTAEPSDDPLDLRIERSHHFWRGWLDGGSTINFNPATKTHNATPSVQAGTPRSSIPSTGFELFAEALIELDADAERSAGTLDPAPMSEDEQAALRRKAKMSYFHLTGDLAHKVLWNLYRDQDEQTLPGRRSILFDAIYTYEPNYVWKMRQQFVKRRKTAAQIDVTPFIGRAS